MFSVRAAKRTIPEDHIAISQTVKAKAMDALKVRINNAYSLTSLYFKIHLQNIFLIYYIPELYHTNTMLPTEEKALKVV